MYFPKNTPLPEIQTWVACQYAAIGPQVRGYDVELRPHRRGRTNEQNRFLYAILSALVRFCHETGFLPAGLSPWALRTDILAVYYKSRFGVAHTSKLSTADFGKFVDSIQQSLVEESGGNWEILEPDSAYVRSLIEQGGM